MSSSVQDLLLGIIATPIAGYMLLNYGKKIKETDRKTMLWATRLDVFMGAIILFGLGIYGIVSSLYKIFK